LLQVKGFAATHNGAIRAFTRASLLWQARERKHRDTDPKPQALTGEHWQAIKFETFTLVPDAEERARVVPESYCCAANSKVRWD
jgi:hypothetical protein